jgi:hypothetical protein
MDTSTAQFNQKSDPSGRMFSAGASLSIQLPNYGQDYAFSAHRRLAQMQLQPNRCR